jgi:hypothetical protein
MAKETIPSVDKKGKKRGRSGLTWFLALFMASGVIVYLLFDQISPLFRADKHDLLEAVSDNLQLELETFNDISDSILEFARSPAKEIKAPQFLSNQSNRRFGKRYFIKAGSCLDMRCQNKLIRTLKKNRLSFYKTRARRKTEYFELISFSRFEREEAQVKRRILMDADSSLTPYLVPLHGAFRVSLGRFPDWYRAMDMSFYLDQLYIQTDMTFILEKRRGSYKVVSIYAGPIFSYRRAKSVLARLKKKQGFVAAVVVSGR